MLRDNILEQRLEKEGYVLLPFLNQIEIEELKSFYSQNLPDINIPFHSTPLSSDINYKVRVNQIIEKCFKGAITQHFSENYKYFFGAFTVKEALPNSEWELHQDWTFVNEKKYRSVGVWVPLEDVNMDNGCLGVVNRSHKFFFNVRGTQTVSEYSEAASLIKKKYLTYIPMKAGEAIIFCNNLLHFSPPNSTRKSRISVNCLMFPKDADIIHYYRDSKWKDNQVEKFAISQKTMLENDFSNPKIPVHSTSLGYEKLNVEKLNTRDFKKLYRKHNGNFLSKLLNYLS